MNAWSVPGLDDSAAERARTMLQERLVALIDLQLTLKHIHWNVMGPNFIGVHEMLDPHTDAVHAMTDEMAERIAMLGGEPIGTPGYVASTRTWEEYGVNRANAKQHLTALNRVYDGVIGDHRKVMDELGELDPVSEDMMIGQIDKLELFQWFVRAHIESSEGELPE
ncbi:DNA starvation/stationary phase protection protein [soil metagenome]